MLDKALGLLKYFKEDPRSPGSVQMAVPMGFTGMGMIWFNDNIPAGWLVCQGQLVSKADYPELFRILGNIWGTSTSTHFYVPDGRRVAFVGKDPVTAPYNVLNANLGAAVHNHYFVSPVGYTSAQPRLLRSNEFAAYNAGVPGGGTSASVQVTTFQNDTSGLVGTSLELWNVFTSNGSSIPPSRTINYIIKT